MKFEDITDTGTQAVPFIPGSTILNYEELFHADNLLNGQNDETQQVLLPYLRTTGRLFNEAIKKYDQSGSSGCRVFPSLDLGFPNNVCRLAGGFATGMLLAWNCAEDIVPVDATVNVCTSSVFKLTHTMAHHFEDYNEKIHRWLADRPGRKEREGVPCPSRMGTKNRKNQIGRHRRGKSDTEGR